MPTRPARTALLLLLLTLAATPAIEAGMWKNRARSSEVAGVTCGIKTVGYRFVGEAGQQFRYAGAEYVVPGAGSIELIARNKNTSFEIAGTTRQLEDAPIDEFGLRTIQLSKSN